MKIVEKPIGSQWTDDQWKAIDANGNNILVAAAAGSGKTAVLVERLIRKITNESNPVDVDRLLIATFTNAAASEMRKRIGEAIEKELIKKPSSLHLRRQLSLLQRANISTLHSFCMAVIRKYYYKIDIDPTFRIADDTEAELLREEVMEELFETEYGKDDNDAFYELVDRYSSDRSDNELQILIRRLYDFSRAHPAPALWLSELRNAYQVTDSIDELVWTTDIMKDTQLQLQGCLALIQQGFELTRLPGGPYAYAETFEEDLQLVESLQQATTWNELYEKFQTVSFSKLKTIRKNDDVLKDLQDHAKKIRERLKKQVTKLQQELFGRSPELMVKDLKEMAPVVSTLVDVVLSFAEGYQTIKKEKGLVDFADLEHFALQILTTDKRQIGIYEPSEVAYEYKQQFVEVLVDEYQDTNVVQETIVKLVSKDNNMFMVGDVKQSIYRFRLAEPGLFLTKYKQFQKGGDDVPGWRIDLAKNFRSRSEVVDATNFIFRQVMDETIGEIEYDEDAELKLGASYPDYEHMNSELLLINRGEPLEASEDEQDGIDEEEELETAQLESRFIAKKIKQLIDSKHQVYDGKTGKFRNITYRDIVILMRSMPWAQTMTEEFKQYGIPVYAELSSGYFEATEVSVMMSLLQVIDNPYQDIPLAAVLRSPIVGLEEEELANVRLQKRGSYYDAVKKASETIEDNETKRKISNFIENVKRWRTEARQGALSELIWQLYRETGYYDYVGGISAGKQRQANLRALYDRARTYEQTSFRGLFRFLRFIERMQDRGDDLGAARALGEQEDVVRMMTIHKSKGLEFPVVFVAGLAKQFNMMDLRSKVLLHKELGFGTKYIHPKLRITYPSLPQLAIKKRMHLEMIAEEMRVLYVALTRAKEKLYLLGTVKDAEKACQNWSMQAGVSDWLLPDYERVQAKSYLDWVGPAVLRHHSATDYRQQESEAEAVCQDSSKWNMAFIDSKELVALDEETEAASENWLEAVKQWEPVQLEETYAKTITEKLDYQYPFSGAASFRSKQSVTEIKREKTAMEDLSDTTFVGSFKAEKADRPRFMQKQSLTSTEIGTAVHLVMQHIPLQEAVTKETVEQLLGKMIYNELLTEEQSDVINVDAIVAFFETEIGQRLIRAPFVQREIPFSFSLPAKEAYHNWPEHEQEVVLVQGVIDCLFTDDKGTVLLDYKTDAITDRYKGGFKEAESHLKERYTIQIDLYSRALEGILKEPIAEKYLFFFDGNHLVKM
ncbi:helicase-exonuclease AddAB subunit AddA [Bacillus alkalicellulosilyticus]|uniref:helicase-exonuclease AddAB subunit AddA n=1 Tax=Alkalihalobacterium alkalicellulosilyticum TaxID=1912214 RepID=UPI0009963093|nr:helicase-exonuclease AddAB subunit AddA [Bacillus alkalicellulosilyticus]